MLNSVLCQKHLEIGGPFHHLLQCSCHHKLILGYSSIVSTVLEDLMDSRRILSIIVMH